MPIRSCFGSGSTAVKCERRRRWRRRSRPTPTSTHSRSSCCVPTAVRIFQGHGPIIRRPRRPRRPKRRRGPRQAERQDPRVDRARGGRGQQLRLWPLGSYCPWRRRRPVGAEITSARQGRAAEPKAAAILCFARSLVENRGHATDGELAALRAAGLGEGEIVEVVANTVLNIFTNSLNHGVRLKLPKHAFLTEMESQGFSFSNFLFG